MFLSSLRRAAAPSLAALLLLALSACFHQVVQTGSPPGNTVIDKAWVSTWIFGLVAAPEIDTRQQCPSGVATIETETSFPNGLVGVLTIGIYTPQHVRITCSSRSAMLPPGAHEIRVPAGATLAERAAITNRAVEIALKTHTPVVLHF